MEVYVLLEDMSYWIKCHAVGHFFLEDISNWRFLNELFIHAFISLSVCLSVHLSTYYIGCVCSDKNGNK